MGRYLQPGHEYADGQTITGPSLTEHVADAVLKPTAISEQLLKDPAVLTDELLINDSGVFKKITLQSLKAVLLLTLTSDELSDEVRIPVGSVMDFAGTSEPQGWLFCFGQELSRTGVYEPLYEQIGTTYGAGDGSNTFLLPDCRGRVVAGKDSMGGTSANRITAGMRGTAAFNGDTLGAVGGDERPQDHLHEYHDFYQEAVAGAFIAAGAGYTMAGAAVTRPTTGLHPTFARAESGNVQPTIILNKIIRYL